MKARAVIKRARGLARRGAGAYVRTVREATPNARRYLLLGLLTNVATGILGTVFALYIREAGMSSSVVGDVEGALGLASALVCVFLPPLVSVVGYRWLLVAAGVAFAASRAGQIAGSGPSVIIALGLLYGAGDGILRTAGVAFLSENGPDGTNRTMLFTTDFALRIAAGVVGALLGGLLPGVLSPVVGEVDALRWTIALAAVLFLTAVIPILGVREVRPREHRAWARYTDAVRGFRSWDRLLRLVVPQTLVSFGAGLVIPFVPLFLRVDLDASVAQVGLILGMSSAVMALATLATPLLARRFGLVGTIVLTELASLPMLFVIPLAGALPTVAVAMWLRAALMNMSWPIYNQISVEGVRVADKPLVAGWSAVAWSGAWFAGSVVGGRLAEHTFVTGYFITAALYASGALASWILLRKLNLGTRTSAEALAAEPAEPQA